MTDRDKSGPDDAEHPDVPAADGQAPAAGAAEPHVSPASDPTANAPLADDPTASPTSTDGPVGSSAGGSAQREEFAEEPVDDDGASTATTSAAAARPPKRRNAAADDSPPAPIDDDLIEPSGAELVAPAEAKRGRKAGRSADSDSLLWPDEAVADEDAGPVKVYKPKRNAILALGVLSAIMLALSFLGFSQDAGAIQKSYSPAQMQVLISALEKDKVHSYSDAETTALANAWKAEGLRVDPTADQLSATISEKYPDKSVTAQQVSDSLKKNKVTLVLPSLASLESSIRTQSLIFLVAGLAGIVAAVFYFRGAKWARVLGMVVSGLVVVMWLMQVLNGALSLPVIIVLLAGAVSFFLLLRGRLAPPRGGERPAAGGFGGLGTLFRPRPRP